MNTAVPQAIDKILQSNFDADNRTCLLTLLKLIDNILQQPSNSKVRQLRVGNKALQDKVFSKQGIHLLTAVGFVQRVHEPGLLESGGGEDYMILDNDKEDTQVLAQARYKLAQTLVHQLQCPADSIPKFVQPPPRVTPTGSTTGSFDVYQGQRFDGQSAAVGTQLGPPKGWKSQTTSTLENLQKTQSLLERKLQTQSLEDNRQWSVSLPGGTSTSAISALSNTITSSDSRSDAALLAAHATKQQQMRQEQANRGFTTKAMRDLEQMKKKKVYSHTQLAISFQDGTVVRGNFLPKERIAEVVASIQAQVLLDATWEFDLYVTPPRTLLLPKQTLQELQLVPAAKVHVSWKKPSLISATFLRSDVVAQSEVATSMPQSQAVANAKKKAAAAKDSKDATAKKKKKTKADKEAALMKRMMGKGGL